MRKRFFVYVLGSNRAGLVRTYVGWTIDLDARLAKHNSSRGAKATRGQVWILLYAERLKSRAGAMRREWALKHDRAFRKCLRASAQETCSIGRVSSPRSGEVARSAGGVTPS